MESFHFLESVNNGTSAAVLTLSGFIDGSCRPFCSFYFKTSDARSSQVHKLPNMASRRKMVFLVIRFTLQKT
jgi:hypothetical protein